MDTDLLTEELPELSLNPDVPPEEFFDRCEVIARTKGYEIDRRRKYAGPGFDHLNLHLNKEVMVRMVSTPNSAGRLILDVVADGSTSPTYDEYLLTAKQAYAQLLGDYRAAYKKRLQLGIPRRAPGLDRNNLDCSRIRYAQEKFYMAVRSLAVGEGDVRARLRSVFSIIHVVRPEDLPVPLDSHLDWIYRQLTWSEPRYHGEGTVDATLSRIRNTTGKRIAERVLAIADALDELVEMCKER